MDVQLHLPAGRRKPAGKRAGKPGKPAPKVSSPPSRPTPVTSPSAAAASAPTAAAPAPGKPAALTDAGDPAADSGFAPFGLLTPAKMVVKEMTPPTGCLAVPDAAKSVFSEPRTQRQDSSGFGSPPRRPRDALQDLMKKCGADVIYSENVRSSVALGLPQQLFEGPHGRAGFGFETGAAYSRVWRPATPADVPLGEAGQIRVAGKDGRWWPAVAESERSDGTFRCVVFSDLAGKGKRSVWASVPIGAIERQYEVLPVPCVDADGMRSVETTEGTLVTFQAGKDEVHCVGKRFAVERSTKVILWRPEWGRGGEPGWVDMPDAKIHFPVRRKELAARLAELRDVANKAGITTNITDTVLSAIAPQALLRRAQLGTFARRSERSKVASLSQSQCSTPANRSFVGQESVLSLLNTRSRMGSPVLLSAECSPLGANIH